MPTGRQGSVRRRHSRTCKARDGGRCRCAGGWQLRARTLDGRRHEQGGFPSKEAAEQALRELLREVDRGTFRKLEPVGFTDYAERWLEAVRPTVRPATAVSYAGAVKTHLSPYFGDVDLRHLTPEMARRFVAAKAGATKDDGTPAWSAKTIANILGVLKMILTAAVEDGHLAVNPAERVKPPRREKVERIIATHDELERIKAVAGDPWALIFETLSWTALRRGELLGLRWGAIDLPKARLFVRTSVGRYGEGAPKSAAGRRTVPLAPALVSALRRHRMAQPPDPSEDGGPVFRSRAGSGIDPDNLTRAWTRAVRKAGVRHMPLHSVRHLAVSRMIASGASPKTIQAVVGHASIQLTFDVYGHLLPDDLDTLARRLGALDAAAGVTAGDTAAAEGSSTGP